MTDHLTRQQKAEIRRTVKTCEGHPEPMLAAKAVELAVAWRNRSARERYIPVLLVVSSVAVLLVGVAVLVDYRPVFSGIVMAITGPIVGLLGLRLQDRHFATMERVNRKRLEELE